MAGPTVICLLPTLAAGNFRTFDVVVKKVATTGFRNTAAVFGSTLDPDVGTTSSPRRSVSRPAARTRSAPLRAFETHVHTDGHEAVQAQGDSRDQQSERRLGRRSQHLGDRRVAVLHQFNGEAADLPSGAEDHQGR